MNFWFGYMLGALMFFIADGLSGYLNRHVNWFTDK